MSGERDLGLSIEPTRPRGITGQHFLRALVEAGVINQGERVRRVVIDAEVNGVVVVYVERYGDTRLLNVATTLDGIEIRREEPA